MLSELPSWFMHASIRPSRVCSASRAWMLALKTIAITTAVLIFIVSPFAAAPKARKEGKNWNKSHNFFQIAAGEYNPGESSSMPQMQPAETTRLLKAWANGDPDALAALTPRVYEELRRIAGRFMQNE